MNNKGFMMAEVVVVAAIVLGILTGIYTAYSKVFTRYSEVISYYNVDGIYKLASYRDNMVDINATLNNITSYNCNAVNNVDNNEKLCIITKGSIEELINSNNVNVGLSVGYKDYLKYLENSVSFTKSHVMVLEYKIDSDDDKTYYSYLEVGK